MSSRPCAVSAALSSGTRVRWPAASDDTPTICTSFSIAWRAASAGVANSGPISTSKPRSANAEAITFWPRSWPSWPTLATRMRGRRPSFSRNCTVSLRRRSTDLEIGERGGDNLLAAIVAILADLGDQNARPAALILPELHGELAQALHRFQRAGLPLIDSSNRPHFRLMAAE